MARKARGSDLPIRPNINRKNGLFPFRGEVLLRSWIKSKCLPGFQTHTEIELLCCESQFDLRGNKATGDPSRT